jgi:hypothetical protein
MIALITGIALGLALICTAKLIADTLANTSDNSSDQIADGDWPAVPRDFKTSHADRINNMEQRHHGL